MRDRRQEVRPQALDVLEDRGRLFGQTAIDDLLAEAGQHVGAVLATRDADESQRSQFLEQALGDAVLQAGAKIREPSAEIRRARDRGDEAQRGQAQRGPVNDR